MLPHAGIDLEAKTLADMLATGQWLPHEITGIQRKVRARRAEVEAGLSPSTAAHWTARLRSLDPQLRLRWDFTQGWVVERAVPEWGCWAICGVLGQRCVPLNLIEILRRGDMQRYSPKEYLAMKREAAAQVAASNEKAGNEKVLAAVDKLSEKRCKEFLEVEDAIRTGDKIVAHGATEKSLAHIMQSEARHRQASFREAEIESFNSTREV